MNDGTQTEETKAEEVDPKVRALAKHLDCETDDVSEGYRDGVFEYGRQEYLVFTDEEADAECKRDIRTSLWAFSTSFLMAHVTSRAALEALDSVRERLCEDANELVFALVKDFDHLVEDAIGCDGRGHFIGHYDHHEYDQKVDGITYYIYRTN